MAHFEHSFHFSKYFQNVFVQKASIAITEINQTTANIPNRYFNFYFRIGVIFGILIFCNGYTTLYSTCIYRKIRYNVSIYFINVKGVPKYILVSGEYNSFRL